MVTLVELWIPILVAAVAVFIASSVIHMALPIHKKDYGGMPNEEKVLEAMRAQGVGLGDWHVPHAAHEDMSTGDAGEVKGRSAR
jgi:hypothetical protein